MDPVILDDIIAVLKNLLHAGALPKADFSLTELEGAIAKHLRVDVSNKQLISALGALGVNRTSHRVWSHQDFGGKMAEIANGDQ